MHIRSNNMKFYCKIYNKWIEESQIEKNLGIIIINDLKSSLQCLESRNKANRLLEYIAKNVYYKSKEIT